MQIKRILLIFFMIGILGFSPPVIGTENSMDVDAIQNPISTIDENISTKTLPELNDVPQEFVLFAQDERSFEILSELTGIKRTYHGLEAVIVDSTVTELTHLQEISDFDFYFSSHLQHVFAPDINLQSDSSIGLDGTVDSKLLEVDHLWSQGYRGQNVTVGVFDTGIDFTHPALNHTKAFNYNINVEPDGTSYPITKDHGTFVAGMIVANGTKDGRSDMVGTAPAAMIGGINIGTHPDGFLVGDMLAGWDWMIQNNDTLEIVNMSWGGGDTVWDVLVDKLEDANILVVGAAGNDGPGYETVGGPGNAIAALSVGATDQSLKLASFSSRGYGNQLTIKPDVLGPGHEVDSTLKGGGYGVASGTSFSSPAVAGVAAVLISALEENGYSWNPGLIKTALMRGAFPITNNERQEGSGFVNVTKSWEYIQGLSLNGNLPLAVQLTPSVGPISYLKTLPQDITTDLTMTLITSAPGDVNLQLTGDLPSFVTLGSVDPGRQSQVISLTVDTSSLVNGEYSGEIVATIGNDEVRTTWTITIVDAPISIGAIDTYYPGGNVILSTGTGSSATGAVIQNALSRGVWIEELNQPATTANLNQYDFYWSAGPSGWAAEAYWSEYSTNNVITQTEIDAIANYVESGGDFILTIDGSFEVEIDGQMVSIGTNVAKYNQLLSNFGMEASTEAIEIPYPPSILYSLTSETEIANHVGSLTDGVNYTNHKGNYLNIINPERVEIIGEDRSNEELITMATYVSENGGRAFVASSTDFYSNAVYYGGDSERQNRQFTDNLIDWAAAPKKINKLSGEYNNGIITGKFQLWDTNGPGSGATINLLDSEFVEGAPVEVTSEGNGIYSFTIDASEDGLYEIKAEFGGQYVIWSFPIDTTAPIIEPLEFPNNSVFEANVSLIFKFRVEDYISEITKTNIVTILEGVVQDLRNINYKQHTNELSVLISGGYPERDTPYELIIQATDSANNTGEYIYNFWIGEGPPPSPTPAADSSLPGYVFMVSLFAMIPILRRKRN